MNIIEYKKLGKSLEDKKAYLLSGTIHHWKTKVVDSVKSSNQTKVYDAITGTHQAITDLSTSNMLKEPPVFIITNVNKSPNIAGIVKSIQTGIQVYLINNGNLSEIQSKLPEEVPLECVEFSPLTPEDLSFYIVSKSSKITDKIKNELMARFNNNYAFLDNELTKVLTLINIEANEQEIIDELSFIAVNYEDTLLTGLINKDLTTNKVRIFIEANCDTSKIINNLIQSCNKNIQLDTQDISVKVYLTKLKNDLEFMQRCKSNISKKLALRDAIISRLLEKE